MAAQRKFEQGQKLHSKVHEEGFRHCRVHLQMQQYGTHLQTDKEGVVLGYGHVTQYDPPLHSQRELPA